MACGCGKSKAVQSPEQTAEELTAQQNYADELQARRARREAQSQQNAVSNASHSAA